MPVKYLSVCSGIEAATCAWHPLGWTPFGFSEIEAFPSAVLAHHYGSNLPGEAWASNGVPNFGDMTHFEEWPNAAIDLLVGGTPCQDFSVAGLRAGMDGVRGSLTLTYAAIARKYRPRWVAWENVPGVLSSNEGRDFASLLGLLSGRLIEVPKDGWRTAGIVEGYERAYGLAWRVLDAQFVRVDGFARAVPQRRRRVFVIGYFGDWRRAAAVLLERESLSGNPAPRREAGKAVAPTISARTHGGGGLGTDFDCDGGLIASTGNVSHCLNAGGMGRQDYETETVIATAHALRAEGFDASEDGTGRGTPIVPVVAASLTRGAESVGKGGYAGRRQEDDVNLVAIQERAISENPENGPDGVGIRIDGAAYTMEARTVPQAIAFDTTQITSKGNYSNPRPGEPCHGLASGAHAPAIAFDLRGREGGSQFEGPHETANIRAGSGGSSKSYVAQQWAVRRLLPIECERLQAFKDRYTAIEFRGKPAADGPRYKALGNSMAVNVMRWLGQRIQMVEEIDIQ